MIQLFSDKKDCCGCGACASVCPHHAIDMQPDEYGFVYPVINSSECIECGACLQVCNFQRPSTGNRQPMVYAAQRSTEAIRHSASGGVFASLAATVIKQGGVAFGCTFQRIDGELAPVIAAAASLDELPALLGSKYVQSSTAQTYLEVRDLLRREVPVLYSGLPCQIAGLKGFLRKDYPNLVTMDIICHGTPNARMFQGFVHSIERPKLRIDNFNFRSKARGWGGAFTYTYTYTYTYNNGKQSRPNSFKDAAYYRMFLESSIYRDSCYSCPFASSYRGSDLTIGDCWGIEREYPDLAAAKGGGMEFHKGMSCVLVNTEKGIRFFNDHAAELRTSAVDFDKIARYNQQLNAPSRKPQNRNRYLTAFARGGYPAMARCFYRTEWKSLAKEKLSGLIPEKIKCEIKRIIKYKRA